MYIYHIMQRRHRNYNKGETAATTHSHTQIHAQPNRETETETDTVRAHTHADIQRQELTLSARALKQIHRAKDRNCVRAHSHTQTELHAYTDRIRDRHYVHAHSHMSTETETDTVMCMRAQHLIYGPAHWLASSTHIYKIELVPVFHGDFRDALIGVCGLCVNFLHPEIIPTSQRTINMSVRCQRHRGVQTVCAHAHSTIREILFLVKGEKGGKAWGKGRENKRERERAGESARARDGGSERERQ